MSLNSHTLHKVRHGHSLLLKYLFPPPPPDQLQHTQDDASLTTWTLAHLLSPELGNTSSGLTDFRQTEPGGSVTE